MFSQTWFWLYFASFTISNARGTLESRSRGDVTDFAGYLIFADILFCISACFAADHWWHGPLAFAIGFVGSPVVNTLLLWLMPPVERFFMLTGRIIGIALLVAAAIALF